MKDYTEELVIAILQNQELIDAFLERTTAELFPVYYNLGASDDFYSQEGNTLRDSGPGGTRVPKRDSLKENLMVLKADVESALNKLDPWDQISVEYYFRFWDGKRPTKSSIIALAAVTKIVELLNNGKHTFSPQ